VDPPDAILRRGNYTAGVRQAEQDALAAQKKRSQAKREVLRLKREAAKRRDAASQANRKRSKRGLASKDHDGREKINLVRVTGKDGSDGKRLTQLGGRVSQARKKMESVEPSPGEIRKILLAIGIANVPHLIIMDEPTNHLNLPSIECLEQALMGALADCCWSAMTSDF
jgi:ABC-type dipeptide/oligopeptide/nickel transport system ATPase component